MTQIDYKDVRVPLDVWGKSAAGPNISRDLALRQAAMNASQQAASIIDEVLRAEGALGWQPDEATDLVALLGAGRVAWRHTGGILFSWKFTFDFATIHFRRPVSPADPERSSSRACAQCGSPMGTEARFCSSCGTATTDGSAAVAIAATGSARCSFCGKGQADVRMLVSGKGASICDECIQLGHELTAR